MLRLDLKGQPEVFAVLGVGDLKVVQIEIASHYVTLSEGFAVIIKLPVVGLLSRAAESVTVLASTQIKGGL